MEPTSYLRAVFALAFVLGLIGLAFVFVRRFEWTNRLGVKVGKAKGRLSVEERIMIDPRHSLVLVKRDDIEHLIMLGPTGDIVVEHNIPPVAPNTTQEP